MILDSCITSGNKSLANNMSTMGLCSRYAGLIWSDPVSHDCGSFLGCGPAIMPYSRAHGDCCGDPKMMRNSNFKFEETARGCFTPKWYEMTWGYTFYKKAHTQLHWKLQHGSLQSWTQNLGNAGTAHCSKNTKDCFQHSWDQEKSCLNLTCFWISTSANHGSLWPKLLPFGCFFQRIGKANCAAQRRRSNVVAMWSSESDGDANISQLVDEQTVRFQGQTGEKNCTHL